MEASARMGVDMALGTSPSRSKGGRLELEVSEREWGRGGRNAGWSCSKECSWTAESISRSRRASMLASLSAGLPCRGRGDTDEARGEVSSRSTVGISSELDVAMPDMEGPVYRGNAIRPVSIVLAAVPPIPCLSDFP